MHEFPNGYNGSDMVGNYYANNYLVQRQLSAHVPEQHNRSRGFCTMQENGSRSTHSITVLMEDSRLVVEIEEQSREDVNASPQRTRQQHHQDAGLNCNRGAAGSPSARNGSGCGDCPPCYGEAVSSRRSSARHSDDGSGHGRPRSKVSCFK
jgi:hypothetical protein